jgi:putative nucleotidyltransferase with HDIG domain
MLVSIICAVFSGPLAATIFTLLLPIFEAIFKKVSHFKYSELTDHKATLIKKLIKNAPGTFNHSIVVSNIAEACAAAIDEDSLLARTCAYYHDIGKLRRPEFFKENQTDGINPHDDLTPELSTNIIRSHAQDGYQLVLKHGLPKEIADVCLEHHGTLPILYFYNKAKKFTDGEVDVKQYCYAGPKPQSKIAAIVMIADGCEAVIRTLKDRSRENVLKTVNKIIDDRMDLGQFDECEITIKELDIIAETIVNNCTGIYHSRVKYPKIKLTDITE